ncbi:putative F-box protein At4g22030 [Wolffia australiana]
MAAMQAILPVLASATPSERVRRTRRRNGTVRSVYNSVSTERIISEPGPAVGSNDLTACKLYAVMEAAADRAEMHQIIGTQRNNWNILLLNSINGMTLAATVSASLAAVHETAALSTAAVILFSAATAMLAAVNSIQPSQLAEEQRNAARLFRLLERKIHARISRRAASHADVNEALDMVLALDKAYPLSLLPGMLDRFPEKVQPAVWWPARQRLSLRKEEERTREGNGWSDELEGVAEGVLNTLKKTDTDDYVKSGDLVVKVNKALAFIGPVFTGLAAVGAALLGFESGLGSWPAVVAVVGGALAVVVNSLEHGAQVGMIFEIFRNCAGYYRQLEEEIELNLGEAEVEERENGEMFELKLALQLGRSLSDLRTLSSSSSRKTKGDVYAGKLF